MSRGEITVTLTRTQWLALLTVADKGLRVVEALNLIQSTVAAERAMNEVRKQVKA